MWLLLRCHITGHWQLQDGKSRRHTAGVGVETRGKRGEPSLRGRCPAGQRYDDHAAPTIVAVPTSTYQNRLYCRVCMPYKADKFLGEGTKNGLW